jgi:hypothetical protein
MCGDIYFFLIITIRRGGAIKVTIISFLFIGWMLSWFKFEKMFIQAFKELFNKEVTKATYYFLFFCIGLFGDLILLSKGNYYI